jgi:general secretion pathway protein D
MHIRLIAAALLVCMALGTSGCPKGGQDYKAGRKAEAIKDFDAALEHYERALKADPRNIEYKLKAARLRFEAGHAHVTRGQKLREVGKLEEARAEFERALALDPASAIAYQELSRTLEMIAAKAAPGQPPAPPEAAPPKAEELKLMEAPPALRPLSRDPINLKLTNDARVIFETIAKLAGITVVFDPDFQSRRIATELTNVTLEQALDVVALQSKAFWQPVTSNIIFVATDNPQKRRDYQEQVVKTIYLSNTLTPQDLTEIVTGLRQVLDLTRIQQVNALNAIVIRATPDKVLLAEKIIRDIDKAKPEVIIQVFVLQARRDRARDLGILPGSSSTLTFTPGGTTTSTTGTTTTSTSLPLNELQRLSSRDYSITLPGALATALLTDSTTKIIQNPEIRTVDGQPAKLRIGDRVPIATGSFQAGVGVGIAGAAGGLVNPLVNTQFQYLEVGVNIDITPRIHPNREVSMKVSVEVSSVTGRVDIGGIQQPIISQRKIDHDIRLREGEVNILGGIIEESETKSISGWPGLSHIPFLRYLFSSEKVDKVDSEVLILLTPRIVRLPEITAENLRGLAAGTDQNVQVRTESSGQAPVIAPPPQPPAPTPAAQLAAPAAQPTPEQPAAPMQAKLRFDPATLNIKPGQTVVVGLIVEDVKDLFSIPLMLQYNPAVISVEEVRHGGFLSGGTQEVAIVQRIDAQRGQAIISATRQQNTPGVNGTGTLVGIVVRGVAAGTSQLSIVQARPRDSQQRPIPVVTQEATVRVQ